MASDEMKDNFLYLALVPSGGLLSYIKQSSIGNVPVETITTSLALIQPETPLYKHRTQGCAARHPHLPQPDGAFYYVQCPTSDTAGTSCQQTKYVSSVTRPLCLCTDVYCIISAPLSLLAICVRVYIYLFMYVYLTASMYLFFFLQYCQLTYFMQVVPHLSTMLSFIGLNNRIIDFFCMY